MAKKIESDPEIHKKTLLESDIREMKKGIKLGIVPKNPTRHFSVGERVHLGAHNEIYVREIGEDGLYYVCEAIQVKRGRGNDPTDFVNEFHVVSWHELLPYKEDGDSKFAKEDRYIIRLLNSSVHSLLHMVYGSYAGIDFNVEYQRDHVWTLEDKISLIESIFNNVDIGKFVFVQLSEKTEGKYYQVLDGKQRLSALCEFYEDRFQYKGYYYSQLSFRDRITFTGYGIAYGFLENPDKRAIYETFIKMNTCGKPMDHKHIDKVKKLLEEL
jgi:hypothetical protein